MPEYTPFLGSSIAVTRQLHRPTNIPLIHSVTLSSKGITFLLREIADEAELLLKHMTTVNGVSRIAAERLLRGLALCLLSA